MTIFQIPDELVFPPPELADEDGLLGVGGDLSPERLLLAYRSGIFPWYGRGEPILWWSPDPRCVLFPERLKVSTSLRRASSRPDLSVTFDAAFHEVIERCSAVPRRGQGGTWITPAMRDAYAELHRQGFAHSVEVRMNGELAGGLYGVAVGRVFCGESMFHLRPNASKVALLHLVERLKSWEFPLIDCQVTNEHLLSLGAEEISRSEFLRLLAEHRDAQGRIGTWGGEIRT